MHTTINIKLYHYTVSPMLLTSIQVRLRTALANRHDQRCKPQLFVQPMRRELLITSTATYSRQRPTEWGSVILRTSHAD